MPRVPEFLTELVDVVVQIKRSADGFRRSEFLSEHGMIDQIVDRRQLRPRIATLLSLLVD